MLDAVIGLPANIFFGTAIPTCILVIKKCRENPNNILFIDAGQHSKKVKNQNILRDKDITRIIETYEARLDVDKISKLASMDDIRENDFNLNIPRYVDTFEEQQPVDLKAVSGALTSLETDMIDIDKALANFCDKLGIEAPL